MFMTNKAWKVFFFFFFHAMEPSVVVAISGELNWNSLNQLVWCISCRCCLIFSSQLSTVQTDRLHISRFPSTCVALLQRWTFHPFHCWMGSALSSPRGDDSVSPLKGRRCNSQFQSAALGSDGSSLVSLSVCRSAFRTGRRFNLTVCS